MSSPATYVARPGYPPHGHLGFSANGHFRLATSTAAPLGGLTLAAARTEFELPERLLSRSVPALVPIALLSLPGQHFGGQPLGIVVSGSPNKAPHRPNAILETTSASAQPTAGFVSRLASDLGVALHGAWGRERLMLIAEVYARFGRALRRFSTAGCHRYSGASDNLLYSFDHREVLLVDLDSSGVLKRLPHLSASLEIVRDVMSGMFNLACELIRPDQIHLSTRSDMLAVDPYHRFLAGYFPEIRVLPELTSPFQAHVAEIWERIHGRSPDILEDPVAGYDLYRSLRFNTRLIYMALFRLAYQLYSASSVVEAFPLPFDLQALDTRIAAFAGVDVLGLARRLSSISAPL